MRASKGSHANLGILNRPIPQPSKTPLSPLSVNAIDEERRLRNLNIRPINDKDSSTDATLNFGRTGPQIAPEDSLSPATCNGSHRVVWSNAAYSRESVIEISDSIKEGNENDSQARYKEFSTLTTSNHAIAVQENTTDAGSLKENEHSDVESTASTWYTPIATHGSTSEKKRPTHILYTEKKGVQSTRKTLFSLGYSASQAVTDAKHTRSSVEEDVATGKVKIHVTDDDIDSGIEEIEKEIVRLTQKLSELKLQKENTISPLAQNLEGTSQEVVHDEYIDKRTVRNTANDFVTKHSPQEQSSKKKKQGRIVSAKFLQSDSRSQVKTEQKPAQTNSTRKNNGIQICSGIQRKSVSLVSSGPHMRRIHSRVNSVKEEKHEKFKDEIGRKFNSQKVVVLKEAIGELGSSQKHDRRDKKSWSLTSSPISRQPVEKKLNFSTHLNSKYDGLGNKNIQQALPMKLEGNQWFPKNGKRPSDELDKKKSDKVGCNNPVGSCNSRVQSSQQSVKHSPALKNTRVVASRYGQMVTPNKGASSATKSPKNLISLRNAHGKRISTDAEDENEKGRWDRNSVKRPAVGGITDSPNGKGFTFRNGYLGRSGLTPCSLKGSKPTCKLGGFVPARHGTKASKQQSTSANEKKLPKGSPNIKAERSFRKPSDPSPQNLGGRMSSKNWVKLLEVSTNWGPSAVLPPRDTLEPERMKLPKISTFRFSAESPRDSGCIKRAVDQVESCPFFSSNCMDATDLMGKRSGSIVPTASKVGIDDEMKEILSFENETDTMDLQGFWHVVDAA